MNLALDCGKRDALHVRLSLEDAECVRGLDALDLPRVSREEDSRMCPLRQPKQAFHLPAGDHAGPVPDRDSARERRLCRLILQQSRNSHCILEADLPQLLNSAPSWSHGDDLVAGVSQSFVDLLECCRLTSSGGAAQVDGKISRIEDRFDCLLLLFAQIPGRFE